eukprot:SRR837773.4322.p4 GENE.SRR837773.4322~~SRR837773.4322.p4  ORF type:complete len:140 (+),score=64.83 SRR837773.4322:66-485(+)
MAMALLRPLARPVARAAARGLLPALQQPALPAAWLRMYSSDASVEQRVITAVKRYVDMRVAELQEQGDDTSAEEKEKMLAALRGDITAATKWDDLGFDDLDKVDVLLEVEEEFKHIIPDDDADNIQSVQETMQYLEKNL